MLRLAVLTSALAGCAYTPGAMRPEPGGQVVTVGCLDVAVARRLDHEANAVLYYRLANRCNRPIQVDLAQVAVVGRFGDGSEVALAPYDPDLEIRPVQLDGRLTGREAIAYPTPRPAAQVCVDAASIVHAEPARWLCFGSRVDVHHGRDVAEGSAVDDVLARDLEETP
ncbi:MAG TPA: hypothetical protein VK932_13295 [Kofleriaceae bacterium]|nr:hypothetical protein [Kofleriaceae bacterium]